MADFFSLSSLLGMIWDDQVPAPNLASLDGNSLKLLFVMILLQVIAVVIGQVLRKQKDGLLDPAIVRAFNRRVTSWLTMTAVLVVAIFMHSTVVVAIFGVLSFWALREFITMTPTRRADHRALFWTFFILTPAQYVLVGFGEPCFPYFSMLIPVYASLLLPARIAFTGDHKRFLERAAKIQFGLLVCVYSLSYAPAILHLKLKTYQSSTESGKADFVDWDGSTTGVLIFFVLMVQLSDFLQFMWDRLVGKHVICQAVNASKTWEGLFGGVILVGMIGAIVQALLEVTPFSFYGAGGMAALVSFMGGCGSITMSAIKRDRGIKDYGTLVHGHAGILDRLDSVCFAAPLFYYVTRYILGPG